MSESVSVNLAAARERDSGKARSKLFAVRQWPWLLTGLFLTGYGLIAFNAGTKLSPLINNRDEAGAVMASDLPPLTATSS